MFITQRVEKLEKSVEGIAEDVQYLKDRWVNHEYEALNTAPIIDIIPSTIPVDEQPLPCPFCGEKAMVETTFAKKHYGSCENDGCAAMGPSNSTRAGAVASWNQMVRAMDAAKKPAPAVPVAEPEQWTSRPNLLESDGSRGCEWANKNMRFMERSSGPRREFRLDVKDNLTDDVWYHGSAAAEIIASAINAAYEDGITAGKKEAEAKPVEDRTAYGSAVETPAQKIALKWTVDGKGFGIDANTPGKKWVRDHIEIEEGNAKGVLTEMRLLVDKAWHDYTAAGAIARAIDDIAKSEYERGKKEAALAPAPAPAIWEKVDTHSDKKSVGWDWVNANVRLMARGDMKRVEVRGLASGNEFWWVDSLIPAEIAKAIDNAVADEREACARVAEGAYQSVWKYPDTEIYRYDADITSTIRSRTEGGSK